MTLPTTVATGVETGGGQQEPPFAPAPIEEMMRLLVKAGRAHQLYLPNNPVYKGAIEALRAAFAPVWAHVESIALRFTETEIRWYDRPVLVESSKSADSLPWTFFKDGIREVELSRGFEAEELDRLLEILQRVRKAWPEEDDLLTMLWEADFTTLRYRYVDLGAEATAPLSESDSQAPHAGADAVRQAMQDQRPESLNGVVNMQDFDATLYFLDERELEYLRHEIEREYAGDLRSNVAGILFDIFEAQSAPAVRAEIGDLLENLLLVFLASGQLRSVAYLLAESSLVAQRAANVTPEQRERLARLTERLSAAEPLAQLLQALDESADLPAQADLVHLFEQLRPAALHTIFAWLPRLQNAKVKALVEQAADRLAGANTAELVQLILSSNATVASEAVRRAGAMRAAAAVAPLAKLLAGSASVGLRQLAVKALTDIGTAGALQALERSIEDADRDVRVATVRTLGARGYRGVFARLEQAVKGTAIRGADLTEKMAFFEAYGAMCGDAGVAYLDGILNGKTLFGRREDPELRACAAIALGRIGTARATEILRRGASEKDVVVRNAVSRALRGGPA